MKFRFTANRTKNPTEKETDNSIYHIIKEVKINIDKNQTYSQTLPQIKQRA